MANPRKPPAAQPRLEPSIAYREVTLDFDRSAFLDPGTNAHSIPISISSETPVERYDFWDDQNYLEVLDHSTDAVDLSLAGRGLPFLDGHDTRQQLGLVENVRVDADRVMRGEVRFSQRAEAQALRQDMIEGIRTKISVGYKIDPRSVSKTAAAEGTPHTVRISRWTPMEASSVAIPADHSVGVGRAADFPRLSAIREDAGAPSATATKAEENKMSEEKNEAPVKQAPVAAVVGRSDEQSEGQKIAALAKQYGFEGRVADWTLGGATLDKVRHEIMDALKVKNEEQAKSAAAPAITLTAKERKHYNWAAGILAAADRREGRKTNSFELEVSDDLEKTARERGLPINGGGLMVPMATDPDTVRAHNAMQHFTPGRFGQRAGLDSATSTKGAELKFTVPGEFLPLLRANMTSYRSGAAYLSGLQGPVAFPDQTAAGTASWVAENPGSNVADSNLLLGQITLAPKTLQSSTSYSRQLLAQSVIDADGMVRADLAAITAIALDNAWFNGTGASNQPTGILSTAGIGSVALGTNGLTPTYANLVDLETTVTAANADQFPMAYFVHPTSRGTFKKATPLSNTIGTPVYGPPGAPALTDQFQAYSRVEAEMNGYPTWCSTQIPNNLTKGTSSGICLAILFGAPSQAVIGDWGMFEIIVDPYSLKKQGMIELTSFAMFGIAVKYPAAFGAIKDALA
jgi:HK97 family phage major capsid protein